MLFEHMPFPQNFFSIVFYIQFLSNQIHLLCITNFRFNDRLKCDQIIRIYYNYRNYLTIQLLQLIKTIESIGFALQQTCHTSGHWLNCQLYNRIYNFYYFITLTTLTEFHSTPIIMGQITFMSVYIGKFQLKRMPCSVR